jgi:hypothetical protein
MTTLFRNVSVSSHSEGLWTFLTHNGELATTRPTA